ncbi:MAG: carbon starvation protein A [Succinivibrionaceae bacterium]
MNGMLLLCIALAYFVVCYWLYGGFLNRVFGIDKDRQAPAITRYDGVDYVPAHPAVLFGHHFASIAGAGPIVGPILASYYGWLPALLWILIGCVFVGAVHDFASLFLSVRNGGKSIGYVIEKLMGLTGRQLFLIFCFACLILVVAIFGLMVCGTFMTNPAVATASITFILIAPIFGKVSKSLGLKVSSLIFVPLVFISVYISNLYPLDVTKILGLTVDETKYFWLSVIGIYICLASITPVQWLLQPRDYLSSYLLYAMMILGVVGILVYNPSIQAPEFVGFNATLSTGKEGCLIPSLFILIACGACSGFHSLVASGTTSKQIANEKDIKLVGYGGMIVEGVLGVMSLITVIYLSGADFYQIAKNPVQAFASGIGTFTESIGIDKTFGITFISLAISTFMMTSLDTATRLARFVWQELFSRSLKKEQINNEAQPNSLFAFLTNSIVATIIVVALSAFMVTTGNANAIWPIFGASNQLLAALALLAITIYLAGKKSNYLITLIPTLFMMVMSVWGLVDIIKSFWGINNILVCSSVFLIVMAFLLVVLSIFMLHKHLIVISSKSVK